MKINEPGPYRIPHDVGPLFGPKLQQARKLGIGLNGFVISCAECPAIYAVSRERLARVLSINPGDGLPCVVCDECALLGGLIVLTVDAEEYAAPDLLFSLSASLCSPDGAGATIHVRAKQCPTPIARR